MQSNKRIVLFVALAISIVAGLFIWNWQNRNNLLAEGLIQANGRIEGVNMTVASKYPGRVEQIFVQEGELVKAGDHLVALSDNEVQAKLKQAEAALEALKAKQKASNVSLDFLKENLPIKIKLAQSNLDHSNSLLEKAQAAEKHARQDAVRFRELAREGTIDIHKAEEAELRWKLAKSDWASAQTAVNIALQQLAQAQLSAREIAVKEEEVLALQAQILQAQAACDEISCVISELTVQAPAQGTVTNKMVELGEVVVPGTSLFEIIDLDNLYLKVYVAEKYLGKLKRGLPARIYIDAYEDQHFDATVAYISSDAEFTPKEVQTQEERVKMVYGVKLFIAENTEGKLTPGMPADAVIQWDPSVTWQRPSW